MKTIQTKLVTLMILQMCAGLFCVAETSAQSSGAAGGELTLRAYAEVEVMHENPDGTREKKRVSADTVVPGDEVIYTLIYDNRGAEPADEISITNPIPKHMEFHHATANPVWLETVLSVDGGQVFGPLTDLTVTDSAGQTRRAIAQDCTHIRWQFRKSLAPGESGQVSYITRLQ